MPDVTDLLRGAAPEPDGPAPLDRIVARGRRRRTTTRAAAIAAPLAIVGLVALVGSLIGPTPAPVIEAPPIAPDVPEPEPAPGPDPDPEPEPEPEPAPGAEDEDPGDDLPSGADDGDLPFATLGGDLFVLDEPGGEGGAPTVTRFAADGASASSIVLEGGPPSAPGLVSDGQGGVVWQPDGTGGATGIMAASADEAARELSDGDAVQLVGRHLDGGVLLERTSGTSFDDRTADLVVHDVATGDERTIAEGIGGWESGVIAAAATDNVLLYAAYTEASEHVRLRTPDGETTDLFEGGELTGEHVRGVGITRDPDLGVVLVESAAAGEESFTDARLLLIDLALAEVTLEVEVPRSLEDDDLPDGLSVRVPDVSTAGRYVLVNRQVDGAWAAPLVYDVDADRWTELRDGDGEPVDARAFVAG